MSVSVESLDSRALKYGVSDIQQHVGDPLHEVFSTRNSIVNTIHCANDKGEPCAIKEILTFQHHTSSDLMGETSKEYFGDTESKGIAPTKPPPPPVPPKPSSKKTCSPQIESPNLAVGRHISSDDSSLGNEDLENNNLNSISGSADINYNSSSEIQTSCDSPYESPSSFPYIDDEVCNDIVESSLRSSHDSLNINISLHSKDSEVDSHESHQNSVHQYSPIHTEAKSIPSASGDVLLPESELDNERIMIDDVTSCSLRSVSQKDIPSPVVTASKVVSSSPDACERRSECDQVDTAFEQLPDTNSTILPTSLFNRTGELEDKNCVNNGNNPCNGDETKLLEIPCSSSELVSLEESCVDMPNDGDADSNNIESFEAKHACSGEAAKIETSIADKVLSAGSDAPCSLTDINEVCSSTGSDDAFPSQETEKQDLSHSRISSSSFGRSDSSHGIDSCKERSEEGLHAESVLSGSVTSLDSKRVVSPCYIEEHYGEVLNSLQGRRHDSLFNSSVSIVSSQSTWYIGELIQKKTAH